MCRLVQTLLFCSELSRLDPPRPWETQTDQNNLGVLFLENQPFNPLFWQACKLYSADNPANTAQPAADTTLWES